MREAIVRLKLLLQRTEGRGEPEPSPLNGAELLAQPSMIPTQPLYFPVDTSNNILSNI